jgi:hypothetical protein
MLFIFASLLLKLISNLVVLILKITGRKKLIKQQHNTNTTPDLL